MSPRLDVLRKQFTEARDGLNAIEAAATAAGRELTPEETAQADTLQTRCEELSKEIEPLAKRAESLQKTADVLSRITPTGAPTLIGRAQPTGTEMAQMTAGEYLSLHFRSTQLGDAEAVQMLQRAVAGQTTADNGGIIPVPIVGDLIKLADDSRPVFQSFTDRPMPTVGKTFTRPRVTQRVQVGEQAAQLDEVPSRKMTITGDEVTKRTFAGVLALAEQDIDWTEPALLDIVLADFIGYYSQATELAACTHLETLASATSVWDGTSIADVVASVITGVETVYAAAKRMPDTMWWSLSAMLAVAQLTNTNEDTTAFTVLTRALSDAGLKLNHVVGPQLSADIKILGCSSLVERYEQQKGFISAANVSHLGADIAYRGHVAFHGRAAGHVLLEP